MIQLVIQVDLRCGSWRDALGDAGTAGRRAGDGEGRVRMAASVCLNNGVRLPMVGIGLFRVPPEETPQTVRTALGIGYRLIDTAASYGNEAAVGETLMETRIARNELFITTKLWNADHGFANTTAAFAASLRRLRLTAVDLYLIHWPMPGRDLFIETWRALEEIYFLGGTRAIGVSNFDVVHLDRLLREARIVPAVNQVEMHPGFPRNGLRAFCRRRGIQVQAWNPLGQGKGLLEDPIVLEIAERNRRCPAQVVLRWHLQRGTAVIPKSVHCDRMQENLALFDFELGRRDMEALSRVGSGHDRLGPDPETFDVA
jgi:2,5-diketo-D-gluconate reductase A